MKLAQGLRILWWLPLYLAALYWLTQQLDALNFAPDPKWRATVQLTAKEATHATGTIRIPDQVAIPANPRLLILNVGHSLTITYPNGIVIGNSGSMADPIARNKHRPLLYPLYQPVLQAGGTLPIEVVSPRAKTLMLEEVYIGPAAELETAFKYNNLIRQNLVKMLVATLWIASLLIGSIWLFYPSRKEYLWYSIGTALWATHSYINLIVRDVPVRDAVWAALIPLLIGLSVLSMVTMVYYYMPVGASGQRRHKRPLLYLWAGVLLLATPLFFLTYDLELQARYQIFWHGLLALMFSMVLAYVINLYWERQTTKRLLFVLCGFAMLVFGLHDALVQSEPTSTRPYLLHFAAMLTLLTQYFLLVRRFVSSLRETQYYAHHLEELVDEREQELEANYQKIRVMEQEKAVVDERERIMRDIHDGFGGHLVSTLAMLEHPDTHIPVIKENIQDALNDLRLVIDSLDFDSQDITTALGMFRSRNSRKIKQAGFELRWAVEDIATPVGFGAEKTLQLLRIVQEAITNAIKHSGGNTITVSTGTDADNNSFIQVEDNGRGIPMTYQPGKGLASMRKRAANISAALDIHPHPSGTGTRVRICLTASPGQAAALH